MKKLLLLLMLYGVGNAQIIITSQPVNDTVVAGQAATFSVIATGSSLNYMWYRQGISTGINTATCSFTSATSMHNDSLQCVIWNNTDTVSSNVVRLYVYNAKYTSTLLDRFSILNADSIANPITPTSGWTARIIK
jgi:hypothetical protein